MRVDSTTRLKLDHEAVRRRAVSISGCVEIPQPPAIDGSSQQTIVCSFLVGCHGETGSYARSYPLVDRQMQNLARLTIYCDTGTVAIARVLDGQVRQTFRRSVTSLDVLERCMRHPAELTAIDWNLVGSEEDGTVNHTNALSVSKNLELLEVGVAILRGERDKLIQHAKVLESTINSSCENERKDIPSPSKNATESSVAGMEFQFSLAVGPMKHVDQCLNDINQMGKLVRGVATNGIGTVFLYGNGGVAYTPNIPRALYHRLSQLRTSKLHSSRPSYVSLGTKDRYYVSFHDGTYSCKGPKALERALSKSQFKLPPLSVAFGSHFDCFFIVFSDGSCHQQGRGIPSDLEKHLDAHTATTDRSDLACVNLGPSNEWFLRCQDGHFGFGGISREMDDAIQELLQDGHRLNFLDFGENGSYFVSYD